MPQHDFRTQATLACEAIFAAAGIRKADRTSLEKAWTIAISCITESTLVTVANKGEPDFKMLRKLYCSEVLLPLHSLILDYPAPSFTLASQPRNTTADLDAYLWYGSLWAVAIITSMEEPFSPASKQTALKCGRLFPRVVQLFADTAPWLNETPRQLVLNTRGSIRKWCLDFLMVRCQGRELSEEPSLEDVRIVIPVIFSLRDCRLGVPGHDMTSILFSTLLLHQHIGYLLVKMERSRSMKSHLVVGSSIAGVSFSDLVRHIRDTARSVGAIPHMRPLQCYQIEVRQLGTLATAVVVTGSDPEIPRPPALIDAFASNRILTYTASLCQDPRADLVRNMAPEENIFPLDTAHWEELVFPAWGRLVNSAYLSGNDKIAAELVDSKFLFLLERWSLKTAQPQALYGIIDCTPLRALQSLAGDPERRRTLQLQLSIICQRILRRPDASEELINIWTSNTDVLTLADRLDNVCSCVGCTSLDAATLRCSVCQSQAYCSPECQKNDWKKHKRHCKRATK